MRTWREGPPWERDGPTSGSCFSRALVRSFALLCLGRSCCRRQQTRLRDNTSHHARYSRPHCYSFAKAKTLGADSIVFVFTLYRGPCGCGPVRCPPSPMLDCKRPPSVRKRLVYIIRVFLWRCRGSAHGKPRHCHGSNPCQKPVPATRASAHGKPRPGTACRGSSCYLSRQTTTRLPR